jgi:hypothetical protein
VAKSPIQLRQALAPILLFALTWWCYRFPFAALPMDSHYTVLLGEQILHHGTFDLAPRLGLSETDALPYQLFRSGPSVYHISGTASAVLSVPVIAVMNGLGHSTIGRDGQLDPVQEMVIQRETASLVAALTVVMLYGMARRRLGVGASMVAALVFAFGTSLWSTSSRVLWSHTWGGLLLTAVLCMVVHGKPSRPVAAGLLAGSLMAWMCAVRPILGVSAFAAAILMATQYRHALPWLAAAFAAWSGVFAWFNWSTTGHLLPVYHTMIAGQVSGIGLEGVFGLLVSPSRGLITLSPFFVVTILALALHRTRLADPALAATAAAAIVAGLLAVGLTPFWIGGHCFGSRYTTDLLPWIFVLGVQAWDVASRAPHRAWYATAAALLAATSIWIHSRGVFPIEVWLWNSRPQDVMASTDRVWDWRHPQFLAGLTYEVPGVPSGPPTEAPPHSSTSPQSAP